MPVDRLLPVVLLLGSNVFMTFAWYGHLKYKSSPLLPVIAASWGIALFEYMLMVPANRWGSAVYSAPQLKGMQEVITLLVFAGFSAWYLGQPLRADRGGGVVDLPGLTSIADVGAAAPHTVPVAFSAALARSQ